MDRSNILATGPEEELENDGMDEEMLNLVRNRRRGSADVRKPQSWMQKLNPKLV